MPRTATGSSSGSARTTAGRPTSGTPAPTRQRSHFEFTQITAEIDRPWLWRPSLNPADVPKNIGKILKWYFDFPAQPFHIECLEAMFQGGHLAINLPTDHGKSILTQFFFPILSLMENPNESHILCGATINDARRRLLMVQRELETNKKLIEDWPLLAKPPEKEGRIWTATAFNIAGRTINRPDPSIRATGWTGSEIRQSRGKLMMDDIESPEVRYSPTLRRQLRDFVETQAIRCEEATHESTRPLLCLIGTPMDVDSIHFHVQDRGWRVIRYPVWHHVPAPSYRTRRGYEMTGYSRKFLWKKQAKKVYSHIRALGLTTAHPHTHRSFAVAYMMDPTGGDKTVLSERDIGKAMLEAVDFPDGIEPRTFVSLDPASGKHRHTGADYAGIVVARIHWNAGDELPYVTLLEAHKFTDGLFEQVDFCASLAAQYGCDVIYEVNSQQGGQYQNAFMHKHPEVKLIRHLTTASNKADKYGLTILKSLLRAKRLRATQAIHLTDGAKVLREEIRDLGQVGADDHIAMALWFLVHHAYQSARYYNRPAFQSGYAGQGIRAYANGFGFRRPPPTAPPTYIDREPGYGRR